MKRGGIDRTLNARSVFPGGYTLYVILLLHGLLHIAFVLVHMSNYLSVGLEPPPLPKSKFLFIANEVPRLPDYKRPTYFDHRRHSFDPLRNLDDNKICDIVDIFRALFVVTGGTLTETTGLDAIGEALAHENPRLDTLILRPGKGASTGDLWAYSKIQRLMRSPLLRNMLCNPKPNFDFNAPVILCRVNPSELRGFNARALTYFLIAQSKRTIVLPEYDPYAHDIHADLILENRFRVGVRSLHRIERKYPDLHDELMQIPDKTIAGALHADALELAKYARTPAGEPLKPGTEGYDAFVDDAMRPPPPPEPVALWVPPSLPKPVTPKPRRAERQAPTLDDPYE